MKCYSCGGFLSHELTFKQLLSFCPLEYDVICQKCRRAFVSYPLPSEGACISCGRVVNKESEMDFLKAHEGSDGTYCYDCFRWLEVCTSDLVRHQALLEYRPPVKEWIVRYKYQGDIRQAQVMKKVLQSSYKQWQDWTWGVLPSSPKSLQERGFHATGELLKAAKIEYVVPFHYIGDGIKQATKTRKERLELKQPFEINEEVLSSIVHKRLVIFDDIYTTGATMMSAKQLLREYGVQQVRSVSLARDTLREEENLME